MANDAIFYPDPAPFEPQPKVPAAALTTGSQPPRIARNAALTAALIAASWPQPNEPQLHQQNLAPRKIAPLTLTYGQEPPRIEPMPARQQFVVRQYWPEDNEPRLIKPQTHPVRIAPLTLVYGQAPPLIGPIATEDLGIIRAQWAEDNEPRLHQRNAYPQKIAPITLVYGQNPPLEGPVTSTELRLILDAWQPAPWDAQRAPFTAAWNVPTVVAAFIASAKQQQAIAQAWAYDPVTIITLLEGAPLLPAIGDEPPRYNPAREPSLQARIVGMFAVDWDAQRAPDLTPPSVDATPIVGPITASELAQIVASWAPAPPQPQSPQRLTPASGFTQPPPAVRRHLELLARTWAEIDRPPLRRIVSAAWDIPIVIANDPPRLRRVPDSILLAWQQEYALVRPVRIAPLIAIVSSYLIWGRARDLNDLIGARDLNATIEASEVKP